MNITIICIGKLKERYWKEAVAEYSKRLSRYCSLSVVELKEERCSDNPGQTEINKVKDSEGKEILKSIKPDTYVIALAIQGRAMTSEKMADLLKSLGLKGKSNVSFIIGGSLGLSDSVLQRADLLLSFSTMTFPHQMMRVILMEQIYRSYKIIKNEAYHK